MIMIFQQQQYHLSQKSVLINSVPIDDNTTIKIEGGVNYVGDYFSPNINQHTYIEILNRIIVL